MTLTMKKTLFLIALTFLFSSPLKAQIDQDQLGGWYMYFFDTQFNESQWGLQGDIQLRNWGVAGDLEQLLLRSGITYRPKNAKIKLTLGYGNITTGTFGDSKATVSESRIYQEALFPVQFGKRLYTNHRFRYEQRFVENQDFRTRYRYNLFLNIPLNKAAMEAKTVYLSFYNELFINGERSIGNGNTVELFDRNRRYIALGYLIKKGMKVQFGTMRQTTNAWAKNQLQLSFHHNF